MFCFTYETVVI